MASTEIDFQPAKPKKTGLAGKWEGFRTFCYNPQNGTFCGRTGKSWGKIGAFYLVYYCCLAAFCAGMWAIFFTTIDPKEPKQQGMDSLIKGNPGMAFIPMPNVETTLIKFKTAEDDTYKTYIDTIEKFLAPYRKDLGDKVTDCSSGVKADPNKPCKFDMADLGDWCTKDNKYGYYEGQPCILMKMNKVFGWEAEEYNNSSRPAPPNVADTVVPGFLPLTCDPEQNSDIDTIGEVQFYPPGGFKTAFFPYTNAEGYMSPLVMARFKNPIPGTLIQVWCKVWANNIYHHKNDKAGSFRFELLVN